MSIRAALAALVLLVEIVPVSAGMKEYVGGKHVDEKAEPACVHLFENVGVLDAPHHIERMPIFVGMQRHRCNRVIVSAAENDRVGDIIKSGFLSTPIKRGIMAGFDTQPDNAGWCAAVVDRPEQQVDESEVGQRRQVTLFRAGGLLDARKDPSAQLVARCLGRDFIGLLSGDDGGLRVFGLLCEIRRDQLHLPFAGIPQLVSGFAQSGGFLKQASSFNGQQNRKNSDDYVRELQIEELDRRFLQVMRRLCLSLFAIASLLGGVRLIERGKRRMGVMLCCIGPMGLLLGWNLL